MNKTQAVKKVDIAIDKIIDLNDAGWGCEKTERILDKLNELRTEIELEIINKK